MPNKLFIGNLPFGVSDAELSELLASLNVAVTSIRVMRDLDTGRSRGFAFVELAPEVDMAAAINLLNGKVLSGRPLTVNEARQQGPREFRGGGRSDRNRNRSDHRGGPHRGGGDRREGGEF